MSILMIEGFQVAASANDWNYKYPGISHSATVNAPGPSGGGSDYFVNFDGGGTNRLGMPCPNGANPSLVVGFAIYLSTVNATNTRPILRFKDALTNDQCGVYLNPSRQLCFYRGATLVATSSFQITQTAWIYLEVKVVFGSSGSYEVRAGGANVLSAAGVNTISTANSSADTVYFGAVDGVAGHSFRVDDIYVETSDFLGECRVPGIRPNAEGTYLELTPSTGTAHYSRVDDSGGADSETVYGATAGLRDTFNLEAITAGVTVAAVQVNMLARSDGARGGAMLVRTNGTDIEEAAIALSTTPSYRKKLYSANPVTAAAWTAAEVNTLEVGFKITS